MWKVSLIAVTAVILCIMIKKYRPELSSLLSITAGIIIFFFSILFFSLFFFSFFLLFFSFFSFYIQEHQCIRSIHLINT